jgi:hypothetical protein
MNSLNWCLSGPLSRRTEDSEGPGVPFEVFELENLARVKPAAKGRSKARTSGRVKPAPAKTKGKPVKKTAKRKAERAAKPKKPKVSAKTRKASAKSAKKSTPKTAGRKPAGSSKRATAVKRTVGKPKRKASSAVLTRPKKAKPRSKTPPRAEVVERKRRKARTYSSRSKLSSFVLGDLVVFRRVRDWNDASRFLELRGTVITKGRDPETGVNYIEVTFEVPSTTGNTFKEIRRFFVK